MRMRLHPLSLLFAPPHSPILFALRLPALFLRWVAFTQESKVLKEVDILVLRQRHLRTLRRFFCLLQTSLPAAEASAAADGTQDCFPIQRICADLDQISKRFFAVRRRGLVFCMRRENRAHVMRCKKRAWRALTFKSFKADLGEKVTKRLGVEQRVVSQSFQSRGRRAACCRVCSLEQCLNSRFIFVRQSC